MPPTHTDEGLRAASEIRRRHPQVGILILSEHLEAGSATRALAESPERLGYLLKERVADVDELVGGPDLRVGGPGHPCGRAGDDGGCGGHRPDGTGEEEEPGQGGSGCGRDGSPAT